MLNRLLVVSAVLMFAASVPAQVTVDFTAAPLEGSPPLEVQFQGTSSSAPFAWIWDFGDGNIGAGQSTTHVYEETGIFDVSLKIFIVGTGIIEEKKDDLISVEYAFDVELSAVPTSGLIPLEVVFEGNAIGADPKTWIWDFGDGGSGSGQIASHTYTTPGTYDVTLTAFEGEGAGKLQVRELVQVVPVDLQPEFTLSPSSGPIPLTVQFDDASVGVEPDSWTWDFGDGTTGIGPSPSHVYDTPGSYDVSLTTTYFGQSATASVPRAIAAEPVEMQPAFTLSPAMGSLPLVVQFHDASTGAPPDSWAWDFGDGATGTGPSPTHTYTQPNSSFDVTLTTTYFGQSATTTSPAAVTTGTFGTIFVDASSTTCPGLGTEAEPFCTLEAALAAASDEDVIHVAEGSYSNESGQNYWWVPKAVRIEGKGAESTKFESNVRAIPGVVFQSVSIAYLVALEGGPDSVGVAAVDCVINSARSGSGWDSGGEALLTLINCTVSTASSHARSNYGPANTAKLLMHSSRAQSVHSYAYSYNADAISSIELVNSTASLIDGDTAWWSTYSQHQLTLQNCTISKIDLQSMSDPIQATMGNTIVSGDGPDILLPMFGVEPIVSLGGNCIGDDSALTTLVALPSDLIGVDPQFVDAANGDLRLLPTSPCIDAGSNALLPGDWADLDCDDDVAELTPLDLDGRVRRHDDPLTPDVGEGAAPIVDIGAYEFGAPLPSQQWTDLGHALAGTMGEPSLAGGGSLCAGAETTVALTDALPGELVSLVVGHDFAGLPFMGGVLVPSFDVRFEYLADASGGFEQVSVWPTGVPSGLTFYLQAWFPDPLAPTGFAASNALQAVVP